MPASDGSPFSAVPYASYTNFTPVLPAFYYDVYSSEQRIKAICMEIDKLINYADTLGIDINWLYGQLAKLKDELTNLENNIPEKFVNEINAWLDNNMKRILENAIKQVYFGLNDDGYFVAYIPDSWSEITFDTGQIYGRSDYGHLILRFNADDKGAI